MHKVERKTQEVSALQLEKGGLTQTLREKDLVIEQLQKQVATMKGEQAQVEMSKNDTLRRCEEEIREMAVRERKEKSKLQREIEILMQ